MTKAFNIFIIGALLLSAALTNITVYQCVDDGDFCITNTCCEIIEEIDKCCSNDSSQELTYKSVCCNEVQIAQSLIFNDHTQSKLPAVNRDTYYPDVMDYSLDSVSLALTNVIRGPPAPKLEIASPTAPIFIKNCSFLC